MTYTELKKAGEKIHEYDKYGEGHYRDAYAGSVETWLLPDGRVFQRDTHNNGMSYTGDTNTYYLTTVTDPDALRSRLAGLDVNGVGYSETEDATVEEIILYRAK